MSNNMPSPVTGGTPRWRLNGIRLPERLCYGSALLCSVIGISVFNPLYYEARHTPSVTFWQAPLPLIQRRSAHIAFWVTASTTNWLSRHWRQVDAMGIGHWLIWTVLTAGNLSGILSWHHSVQPASVASGVWMSSNNEILLMDNTDILLSVIDILPRLV